MNSSAVSAALLRCVCIALCAAALCAQDADRHVVGHGEGATLALWVPAGTAPLRALIVDWASQRTRQDERVWIEAARAWGCAWTPGEIKPGKRIEGRYTVWRGLLAEAAKAAGRPEIAQLPILLVTAQAQVDRATINPFAETAGAPLLGIISHATLGYPLVTGKGADPGDQPILSVSGEEPNAFNRFPDLRTEFRPFRQADKPWALGIQPFADHEFAPWTALHLAWCRDVLDARLGAGGAVRPTDLAAGWLGTALTEGVARVEVAPQGRFAGDRSRASWFPGPRSAALWAAQQNAALGAALRLRGAPATGVQVVERGSSATWNVEGAPAGAEIAWFLDEERVATGTSWTFAADAPGARTLRVRCGERDAAPLALVVPAGRQVERHRVGASPPAKPSPPAPSPLIATAEQLAAARAAVTAIEARLAAAEERARADDGWFLDVVAEGLADGDDAVLRLPGRGGVAAAGCATVPAWRQETLNDGWSFAYRNGAGANRRDKLAFAVAADALRVDAAQARGALRVDFRRDRLRDERLPLGPRPLPGMPTAWSTYDVFAGEVLRTPRPVEVQVELAREAERHDCEVRIPGGAWERPVELRFAWPPRPGEAAAVRIEGYNAGSHRADVAGLAIGGGRIRGSIAVSILPDPWVPQDRMTRAVTYALDLPLVDGCARGAATSSGDLGEARVEVAVRVDERWSGRYRADGGFGPAQGALRARRATRRAALAALPPLPAGGDAVWRRLRSLELAASQPLIDVEAAAAEELLPVPAVADAAAALALLQEHLAWAQAPRGAPPAPAPAGRVGAFGASAALVGDAAIPAAGEGWWHPGAWTVLGPVPTLGDWRHVAAATPSLLHGAIYAPDVGVLERELGLPFKEACTASTVEAPLGVVEPPFSNNAVGFSDRHRSRTWIARAAVAAAAARRIDLVLDVADSGALWLNRRLVWSATAQDYRLRVARAERITVELQAGANELLWQVQDDFGSSWARCHLGAGPAHLPQAPREEPAAAAPPTASDIARGVGVRWRVDLPAHKSRPAVGGGLAVATLADGAVLAVDLASGAERWRTPAFARQADKPAEGREAQPCWDGTAFFAHANGGDLVRLDAGSGAVAWRAAAPLTEAELLRQGPLLVAVGRPAPGWAVPPSDPKAQRAWYGLLAVDAASGAEVWRATVDGHGFGRTGATPRGGGGGPGIYQPWPQEIALLRRDAQGPAAIVVGKGPFIDVRSGKTLAPHPAPWVHAETQVTADESVLVYSSHGQLVVVDWWFDGDGRLHHAERWRQRLELSSFGNTKSHVVIDGKRLYHHAHIVENGPHCPAAWSQLDVHDLVDGRVITRVKPLFDRSYKHRIPPQRQGDLAWFLDSGGGQYGALEDAARLLVLRLGDVPRVLSVDRLPLGSSIPPVVVGDAVLLRTPRGLVCLGDGGAAGRRLSDEAAAAQLLEAIGSAPAAAAIALAAPDTAVPDAPPPSTLRDNRPIEVWQVRSELTAGPLAGRSGWQDLPRELLRVISGDVRDGPSFSRYNMQGRSLSVTIVGEQIDLGRLHGGDVGRPSEFRATLDNNVARVLRFRHPGRGISCTLAGRELAPGQLLRLEPGRYRYGMTVTPAFFMREPPLQPVDVAAAIAGGALAAIPWPPAWRIVGPLRGIDELPEELLGRPLGERIAIGDTTYATHVMPAGPGGSIDATPLAHFEPGQRWQDIPPEQRPAGAFQETIVYAFGAVTAPGDGHLVVNASADWTMTWWVNGEEVYSTLGAGNARAPDQIGAHTFQVRVRAGENLIAVRIASGQKGCSFRSQAGFAPALPATLADDFPNLGGVAAGRPSRRISPRFVAAEDPARAVAAWRARVRAARPELERLRAALADAPLAQQIARLLSAAAAER